jgi:DNA-binding Lrp family transcriptional regulator
VLEQPFRMVAADLGCSENTLLDSIGHLLDTGILSRFGPLYDAVKLGGDLSLAAMSPGNNSIALPRWSMNSRKWRITTDVSMNSTCGSCWQLNHPKASTRHCAGSKR